MPKRGYVPGNVRVISDRANRLKGDRTFEELRHLAESGPASLRADYAMIATYVEREELLAEVRAKAAQGGRAGQEWAKIAAILDRAGAVGAVRVEEDGTNLNSALDQASSLVASQGGGALMTLSSDLPLVEPSDLAALLAASHDAHVVAADDSEQRGTNALWMRRPGIVSYRFGEGSFEAHHGEAARVGAVFRSVDIPGLVRDIDAPAHLAELATAQNR